MENKRIQNIKYLYDECKKEMGLSNFSKDITGQIEDKDLQSFYWIMTNFFLQEDHKKMLKGLQ